MQFCGNAKEIVDNPPEYLVCCIVSMLNSVECCLLTKDIGLAEKYTKFCNQKKQENSIFCGKFVIVPLFK